MKRNKIRVLAPRPICPSRTLGRGYSFYWRYMPPTEPALKRAVVFVDGQNLFHHAKNAFGYHFPNYDVHKLANAVVSAESWNLTAIYFYTGVPDIADNPKWNRFWTNKLAAMGRQGIKVFTRPFALQKSGDKTAGRHDSHRPSGRRKGHRCANSAGCDWKGGPQRIRCGHRLFIGSGFIRSRR